MTLIIVFLAFVAVVASVCAYVATCDRKEAQEQVERLQEAVERWRLHLVALEADDTRLLRRLKEDAKYEADQMMGDDHERP